MEKQKKRKQIQVRDSFHPFEVTQKKTTTIPSGKLIIAWNMDLFEDVSTKQVQDVPLPRHVGFVYRKILITSGAVA